MRPKCIYWIAPAALAAVISAPAIGQDRQADPDRRYEQDHREQRDRRDQDRDYRRSQNLEVRYATIAPPRRHHERRTARPDPNAVWVAGYWDWQGAQWEWVPGRWDHPEDRNGYWIQPRYIREGNGYRYEPGHWSTQRVIEGEQYRQYQNQHREHRRDEDRDRDRDRDRSQ